MVGLLREPALEVDSFRHQLGASFGTTRRAH